MNQYSRKNNDRETSDIRAACEKIGGDSQKDGEAPRGKVADTGALRSTAGKERSGGYSEKATSCED